MKTYRIICEVFLLIMITLLSIQNYHVVKINDLINNNTRFFHSEINDTIYRISQDYELDKELTELQTSFSYMINNSYELSYNQKNLFDELDNYVDEHENKLTKEKVIKFLSGFELDLQQLLKKNAFISNKEMNELLDDQIQNFNVLVIE